METKKINNCVLPCRCGNPNLILAVDSGDYQVQCCIHQGPIAKNKESAIRGWNKMQIEKYRGA